MIFDTIHFMMNHGAKSLKPSTLSRMMTKPDLVSLIPKMIIIMTQQIRFKVLERLLMLAYKENGTLHLVEFFLGLDAKITHFTLICILDTKDDHKIALIATEIVKRGILTNESGARFLMAACRHLSFIAAYIFLDAGVSAEAVDKNNRTALHHLALGMRDNNILTLAEEAHFMLLIQRLVDSGAQKRVTDKEGKTAKQILAAYGQSPFAFLFSS